MSRAPAVIRVIVIWEEKGGDSEAGVEASTDGYNENTTQTSSNGLKPSLSRIPLTLCPSRCQACCAAVTVCLTLHDHHDGGGKCLKTTKERLQASSFRRFRLRQSDRPVSKQSVGL